MVTFPTGLTERLIRTWHSSTIPQFQKEFGTDLPAPNIATVIVTAETETELVGNPLLPLNMIRAGKQLESSWKVVVVVVLKWVDQLEREIERCTILITPNYGSGKANGIFNGTEQGETEIAVHT